MTKVAVENRIWNPQVEQGSREWLKALQLKRAQRSIFLAYEHVPMYRRKLQEKGIKPEDIRSLEDFQLLPLTEKIDLRDEYPFGLLAVPMKKIVRIHASSGTTGKPITAGYTKKDLEMWAENVARIAYGAGVTDEDIAQVAFGYTLFTGAFGLHGGLEKIGAAIIPISSGNTQRQINTMKDFGTTVLVATPSYAMYMAEIAEEMGVIDQLNLRVGLFGAEGSTEAMRRELEEKWNILVTENYGLTEVLGPGVAGECIYKCGMHINEDHFYPEIIDPETGKVLEPGEIGELVITTLTKEGQPTLRYRTRDITRLLYEPCQCGRTLVRMEKVKGRSDDMLIIRGVNVFPSQIETILLGEPGLGPHYEIVLTRKNHMDYMEVKTEVVDGSLLESFSALESLQMRVCRELKINLGIEVKVTLVSPNSLKRFEGKAKRVTDLREGI
ncbi:MAG: phenylacetate--CoA ligase [Clostridiales bacterium]|nr:phenylacetate--CoA ligase [Clostridiales bacterium]